MKNQMKKISAVALTALAVTSLTSSIFAADITTDGGTGTTPITYTVGPTFSVTIPETIAASKTASVLIPIVGQANMDVGKKVSVSIQLANGKVVLNRTSGATDSIDVTLKQSADAATPGTDVTATETEVASFTDSSTNGVANKLFVKQLEESALTAKKAGAYSGTLTFNIGIKNV
ncbi:MAG: hypothetical protein RR988_05305 [Clostridia bacterium]